MAEYNFGESMGLDKEPDWLAKYEGTNLSPHEKFIEVAKDIQAPNAWGFLTVPDNLKNVFRPPVLDRLETIANDLGVDPKTDPEFYVDGGQGRVNLGTYGNNLYRNKSDTAIGGYEMERGGFKFQDAKQNAPIGGITYQKVDTDAFRDTVAPMAAQAIAGAVSAGAFNPVTAGLLSAGATAAQGGDIKDVAASGLLNYAGAAYLPPATQGGAASLGDLNKAAQGFNDVLSTGDSDIEEWDPNEDPSWSDQYQEVLYNGDVLFKDTVNDDISEYQPPPIIPQDWPVVDTGTGGNGGNNGGSQDIPSDPTEEPVGGVGLPNPLPSIPDDEDPNEPDKKQPSLSFLQLFMDIKGALGDQQAYDGAGDTPITQGMLASNGYADRTPYDLFENQPFEKTKRMGDFLYDMEI